jgi:hypothetical protein
MPFYSSKNFGSLVDPEFYVEKKGILKTGQE